MRLCVQSDAKGFGRFHRGDSFSVPVKVIPEQQRRASKPVVVPIKEPHRRK